MKNLVLWARPEFSSSALEHLFCHEKPGPLGQARVFQLCLGVWCLKSQIPSTKLQINLKLQIPNRFKAIVFFVWDFEFRSLLFICFLGFVIWNFNKSMNFQ
jgi:hypothetical protein